MGSKNRAKIRSKKLRPLKIPTQDIPRFKPIPLTIERKVSLELSNELRPSNVQYRTQQTATTNTGEYKPNKPYLQLSNPGKNKGMVGAFSSHYSVNAFSFQGSGSSMLYSKQMFGPNIF